MVDFKFYSSKSIVNIVEIKMRQESFTQYIDELKDRVQGIEESDWPLGEPDFIVISKTGQPVKNYLNGKAADRAALLEIYAE